MANCYSALLMRVVSMDHPVINSKNGSIVVSKCTVPVEKISETTDKARIITKARATQLLQGPAKDVIGLIYEKGGQKFEEKGPVILCSGGFGADFSNDSLLAKHLSLFSTSCCYDVTYSNSSPCNRKLAARYGEASVWSGKSWKGFLH